ncbi:helix-turn-helix domain-containing protein [Paraburkholderia sediminicola]|uniref:helix-turn-helix domain-containing protein n=1 Tax=Paraburkholderia sediminicola TaxID=458836 RepID=UPI0038BBFD6E
MRILDAVYSERSVSRAAVRLNLSQPRVGNALVILRGLLEDRLFVPTGSGVARTELMTVLAPRMREPDANSMVAAGGNPTGPAAILCRGIRVRISDGCLLTHHSRVSYLRRNAIGVMPFVARNCRVK